jgi:hypothetical protein
MVLNEFTIPGGERRRGHGTLRRQPDWNSSHDGKDVRGSWAPKVQNREREMGQTGQAHIHTYFNDLLKWMQTNSASRQGQSDQ